ncbi:ROK family protein [Enterococcus sp.]|uniref:ROK family protein n=1 Tax=Enterococcus sp. TaxID=35783 RepID=UPI0028994BCE|nr:ROK family protein [Enterococcus sp.]
MSKQYLSIDIGGTNIKSALIDRSGNILSKSRIKTPKGLSGFLAAIHEIVAEHQREIRGIAFSTPGKVDTHTGIISFGGALPFINGVSLKDELAEAFDLPVSVINDGKAAALAELWLGNLQGVDHGAAITLGTGLGGGIILDGRLIEGAHFQAGELSFMLNASRSAGIETGESLTVQQLYGFSGSAVAMIREAAKKLSLADLSDGEAVFAAINQRDARVWPLFTAYCREIACVILNVQSVIDLSCYVIGGGISAQEIVSEEIRHQYNQMQESLPLLKQTLTTPTIRPCKFQNDANILGALYQFFLLLES